jgi:hypothetical protein
MDNFGESDPVLLYSIDGILIWALIRSFESFESFDEDWSFLDEIFPPVSKGMSEDLIKDLIRKSEEGTNERDKEKGDCSICLSPLNGATDNKLIDLPTCGHRFHQECLIPWLRINRICPNCRAEIVLNSSPEIGTSTMEE